MCSSFCFKTDSFYYTIPEAFQCRDTVGWVTGRPAGSKPAPQNTGLLLEGSV